MSDVTPPATDQDLQRNLKGAACRAFQPLLLNALGVPATAYIIRRLGAHEYGEWSVATTLVATAAVFSSLGLRGPFVRAVARDDACVPSAFADQLGTRMVMAILAGVTAVA